MIIFDLESGPAPDDVLDRLKPVFEADGRLKDPAKIAADIADKEAAWKERAALSALTGQILVIGLITTKNTEIPITLEGPEAKILTEFWDWWATGGKFIGFCIKHFDVPFIVMRSRILNVHVPSDIMDGRYLSGRWVDLQEVWCLNSYDTKGHSLDAVCRACGLGQKNGDGADFAKLWRTDKPKALDYLRNDVQMTVALAKRLGVA